MWTGFPGSPGYSNFHFTVDGGFWDGGVIGSEAQAAADDAAADVRGAFIKVANLLPDTVTIQVDTEAEILNSDTGEILGVVETDSTPVTGASSSTSWSGASGGVVNWRTNDYRGGRRIRGRTFMVPLAGNAYEDNGTLSTEGRDDLQSFGNALVNGSGSADFGVWSRPRNGAGGVFATVVGSNVPDMAAILRSRRD